MWFSKEAGLFSTSFAPGLHCLRVCLAALASVTVSACITPAVPETRDVLIENVSIVEPSSGMVRPNQSIRIRGDRIVAVGPSRTISKVAAKVVNGSGKYVVPGLWDMHVHLQTWGFQEIFPLLVANGVLGVRDMGTDQPDHLEDLSQWMQSGGTPGVRIYHAGQMIDGPTPPDWPLRLTVENAQEARGAVRAQVAREVDFIKVHGQLDRPSYFAVAQEARSQNIPFAGHVPASVTGIEAAEAGQETIEHLSGTPQCEAPACAKAQETLRVFRDQGTVQVPTLVLFEIEARGLELSEQEQRYVTPAARRTWEDMNKAVAHLLPPAEVRAKHYQGVLPAARQMVRAMKEAGVPILAGTDIGYFGIIPGLSLHKELELLVESGLTPLEALQAATSLPAKVMGRERELGSIDAGKFADLILLNRNPLADIGALRDIHGVIAAGHLYLGEDRLRLLEQAAGRSVVAAPGTWAPGTLGF